uniref:Signal peptidase I family protein n=1 Tax=Solanum tuberosum TaxID=4113 RepID=M1AAA3_SOLTU
MFGFREITSLLRRIHGNWGQSLVALSWEKCCIECGRQRALARYDNKNNVLY